MRLRVIASMRKLSNAIGALVITSGWEPSPADEHEGRNRRSPSLPCKIHRKSRDKNDEGELPLGAPPP
jgi:hypothetical protein